LRKFGGEIVPTTRHRVDLSIFRRFAIGDWIADRAEQARPLIPGRLAAVARSLRGLVEEPRNPRAKTGDDRPLYQADGYRPENSRNRMRGYDG
jgi:hypothetical protein